MEREQEYIRRQLEEEQRHLELLQQQLLQEQAMLLECRWRELEEHRQAERLQRQLQQEQAYLLSLQHDPRRPPPPPDRSKAGLHEPKAPHEPADRAREVQWSHLASLKNNVSLSRDPIPSVTLLLPNLHTTIFAQDPCPPSRSEVLSQSSDSKAEVPDPAQKAWSRSDSDEVPPRVPCENNITVPCPVPPGFPTAG